MQPIDAVDPRRGLVPIGGVDLYAEVAGRGEPVLLLHGGFCSLEAFADVAAALVVDHEVHAFERPGHGRSADIPGEYDYDRGIADVLGYLDARGLGGVHVVGYSDGGILGLLLARDHPERVRSLVAISANLDPSGFAGAAGVEGTVLTPRAAASAEAAKADDAPDPERLAYERLSPDGPAHADVVLAKLYRLWTTQPHIDPASLAAIAAPTLVMAGDRDSIRPDHTLRIAASIPGAELCLVPGTGHGLVAERPAFVTREIRDFLERSGARR